MTISRRLPIAIITFSAFLTIQGQALAQSHESKVMSPLPEVNVADDRSGLVIADVIFEGLTAVYESDVRKAFREQCANLQKEDIFSLTNSNKGVRIISQLLADTGFMNARVEARTIHLSAKSIRLTFVVEEGPPTVIREIKFEGNKVFTDDELRSQLRLVTEMSHDVFDRPTLEYDLMKVRNFMRSRGYLQAKVLDLKLNALNGNLTIVVPVEEGKLFRIGKIIVRDSTRFSPEQIVEMIGLKSGDIADGRRMSEALFDELKDLYGNMGYPQYSSDPDLEYRDNPNVENEGVVDLQITIVEGLCFKIRSVNFQGNQKLTEQYLRPFLLFREGDTYNQQVVKDSLRALSESELLERVEDHYQYDEDAGLMDITFKVVEFPVN